MKKLIRRKGKNKPKEKVMGYHNAKRCACCKEWYRLSMKNLHCIRNKKMRKRLKHLFEALWINNCGDFDIIYYEFAEELPIT